MVKMLAMEAKRVKTGARRLSLCEKNLCFFDLHMTDTFYGYIITYNSGLNSW